MLKSFNEKLFRDFVDFRRGRICLGASHAAQGVDASKILRSVDYVLPFEMQRVIQATEPERPRYYGAVTTKGNWGFILTNAAISVNLCAKRNDIYTENISKDNFPKVKIEFRNLAPSSPFETSTEDAGAVSSPLVIGCENSGRYVEAKNLFYFLNQRFTIDVEILGNKEFSGGTWCAEGLRGAVVLSGLEFSEEVF